MDFGPRQGARMRHGRAMATTSDAPFGSKDAEVIQRTCGSPRQGTSEVRREKAQSSSWRVVQPGNYCSGR